MIHVIGHEFENVTVRPAFVTVVFNSQKQLLINHRYYIFRPKIYSTTKFIGFWYQHISIKLSNWLEKCLFNVANYTDVVARTGNILHIVM